MVYKRDIHCDIDCRVGISSRCGKEDLEIEAILIHRNIRDCVLSYLPAHPLLLRDGRKGVASLAHHVSLSSGLAQVFVSDSQRAPISHLPGQLLPHLQGDEEQQRSQNH